jgi:hypothetical protein
MTSDVLRLHGLATGKVLTTPPALGRIAVERVL